MTIAANWNWPPVLGKKQADGALHHLLQLLHQLHQLIVLLPQLLHFFLQILIFHPWPF